MQIVNSLRSFTSGAIRDLPQRVPGDMSLLPDRIIGTTVDQDTAGRLGLSQREMFDRMKTMGFNTVRLGAYWNQIQPDGPQDARFETLDAQLKAAREAGLKVILTVGCKAPAYPEYYIPKWVDPKPSMLNVGDDQTFRSHVLAFDRQVVEHVRGDDNVVMFQVENEPFNHAGPGRQLYRITPGLVGAEAVAIREADDRRRPLCVNLFAHSIPEGFFRPFNTVRAATRVADVVALDIYPSVSPSVRNVDAHNRVETVPTRAFEYITAHGKRPMVGELEADSWLPAYEVTARDVRENFDRAERQGYRDILFWRQSTVEEALKQGRTDLMDVESELAHRALAG